MDDDTRRLLADYLDGRIDLVKFTDYAVKGKKGKDQSWSDIFDYIFKYQTGDYDKQTLNMRLGGYLSRNRKP